MMKTNEKEYEIIQNVESLGEPRSLWKNFEEISQIPRCSKNEGRIREYIIKRANDLGLQYLTDEIGNIVVKKKATDGYEGVKGIILQSHIDMVCEKNEGTGHDFSRDPLQLRRKGDYLYATDTTLGADNGIGMAAMLSIMEDGALEHGPMEFLFTVDEETGLTGAFRLGEDILEYRRMLNLDTEEEGAIYVGCAGGADSVLKLGLEFVETNEEQEKGINIKVGGLLGGHSGVDVHLGRGNSNLLLARVLKKIWRKFEFGIVDIRGGTKRNAIPRESNITLIIPKDTEVIIEGILKKCRKEFENEFTVEKKISIDSKNVERAKTCTDKKSTKQIIDLLLSLPNGVQAMCQDIPDLVETSTNFATISISDSMMVVGLNSRSSVESALEWAVEHIESISELAGAGFERGGHYPGWKPNVNSSILKGLKRTYSDIYGSEPDIKAIHAGLETGIIGKKFPGMDMVSMGPQIEHPHSPQERVKISSVSDFWNILRRALKTL